VHRAQALKEEEEEEERNMFNETYGCAKP